MSLALQPNLRPRNPRRWLRWLLPAILTALIGLGGLLPPLQKPAQLLTNRHQERHWWTQVMRHIDQAEGSIDAIVYVAHLGSADETDHPIRQIIARLAAAQSRGVTVRVVLDRSPDWGSTEISTKNDPAAALLQAANIPVWGDETNRTTHCKAWIFDQHTCIVGSHNWTRSAATRNREWSIMVDDKTMAKQMRREIDYICTDERKYPPVPATLEP